MLYSNNELKKLIIPLIFEKLLAILVGMVDTIMISGVGEAAVSGVSLVDNINILVINISAALAAGGAVVAGHFFGQKDRDSAGKAAWQLILFTAVVSVIVTVFFMLGYNRLLKAIFGKVEEVMTSAVTYLVITAISIVPLAVYNSCAALFRAMNDSKTTMLISILMNVMNVIGNAILIYGAKIGFAGAAIATTISRTAALILIFYLMFNPNRIINIKGKLTLKPNITLIKKILYIVECQTEWKTAYSSLVR